MLLRPSLWMDGEEGNLRVPLTSERFKKRKVGREVGRMGRNGGILQIGRKLVEFHASSVKIAVILSGVSMLLAQEIPWLHRKVCYPGITEECKK